MNTSDFGRKEVLWAIAAIWGTAVFPTAVTNAVHTTAGWVTKLMDIAVTGVTEAANNLGASFIGTLAPFALPAIAGGYTWKSVADIAKIENKTLRRVLTWWGAALGAGAATTALAPYLVGGAAAYAVGKTPLKWALNKTWALAWATYDGVVGAPLWAVKWMFNGAKNGFSNPTVIPQT